MERFAVGKKAIQYVIPRLRILVAAIAVQFHILRQRQSRGLERDIYYYNKNTRVDTVLIRRRSSKIALYRSIYYTIIIKILVWIPS
jgi:hypothetical protein